MRRRRERRRNIRLAHPGGEDLPIRFELFSVERLEQHAVSLAKAQKVGQVKKYQKLLPRVQENALVLLEAYKSVALTVQKKQAITPAAEWLLDNFHVIEAQVSDIDGDLPESYYRQLPKLTDGILAGYPRVYGIAWALVAHNDSLFNPELLALFVKAYQTVQPLTLGELWAIPITLRVVLVENLRRLAVNIMRSQTGRHLADEFVDNVERMVASTDRPDPPIPTAVLPSAPLCQAYAVQILLRSHDPHPAAVISLSFMNDWLKEQAVSLDDIVHKEHAEQIADNLTVQNIITSMRAISSFDWTKFVEEVSLVDGCLRQHAGYLAMDFLTQDRYRHAIEDLALRSTYSELDIAKRVVDKVKQSSTIPKLSVSQQDPGYYLIGAGRYAFESELNYKPTVKQRLLRLCVAHATSAYIGGFCLSTLLILSLVLLAGHAVGLAVWQVNLLAICAAFPASDIAIGLLNQIIIARLPPRHLPRLQFKQGVPHALSTFVVVPTLLTTASRIKQLLEQVEVRYLANPAGEVRFALLSDWQDADQENLPSDSALLNIAVSGINALNKQYGEERFFIFHRKRLWNACENKWMGWERKRGKLHEFNRLLRGASDTSFLPLSDSPVSAPPGVCYVITLDDDTKLPMDVVAQLVGVAAHPLNQPVFDPISQTVTGGYGLIQPRITATLPQRLDHSLFHQLFAGASGTDAYSSSVSELYQDLFALGTYSGKGLYHVDSFEAALAQRVPENTQLSHDLFESVYVRCALVSDIEFFEEYPSHTDVAASREHRWARGDWQLLPWIFGVQGKNMPMIGRWKMLDNLRRSLLPLASFLTLLASWAIPNAPQWVLIGLVLVSLALPAILAIVNGFTAPSRGVSFSSHFRNTCEKVAWALGNSLVALTLLAQQAWLMSDAIAHTLIRLFITRKQLLKWVTALQAKTNSGHAFKHLFRPLCKTLSTVLVAGGLVLLFNPVALYTALPFLVLWCLAPVVARGLSLPPKLDIDENLSPEDSLAMRRLGRRIWRFFTTFVTEDEHFLPPDNFQELPQPVIAHRSSPTNFGLYLLSIIAAKDFGWIGLNSCVERLEQTLNTLKTLPKLQGHFYNWYDTSTLQLLEPPYISTVDSGNLAGHLLALSQSCREMIQQPVLFNRAFTGLADTLYCLVTALAEIIDSRRTLTVTAQELRDKVSHFATLLANPPSQADAYWLRWQQLASCADTLLDLTLSYTAEREEALNNSEVLVWVKLLREDVHSHLLDLNSLFPWLACAHSIETLLPLPDLNSALPTLLSNYHQILEQLSQANKPEPALLAALEQARSQTNSLISRLQQLAELSISLCLAMNFKFLYDDNRQLFSLGYRVNDSTLDPSYYDLLASEARLTSLIAIAKRDVSSSHWFHLGRRVTRAAQGTVLLSWSGSMFEYLMPSLVTFTPRYSLLDQTCRLSVKRQIEYGKERGVPWGISESAFNDQDLALTYQYSAFGVPGLGMKRGLAEDLVIAPYATALAAMYLPHAAVENFKALTKVGALGALGFYEALDYTPIRLAEGQKVAVIKCYMAHHQGMSLVAFDNVVFDGAMRHRFHSSAIIQSAELLLQERIPQGADSSSLLFQSSLAIKDIVQLPVKRMPSAMSPIPSSHLLANGHYSVMMTAAGSGYSQWRNLAITRWREDVSRDAWGSYFYLRDVNDGSLWSAGYQPTLTKPDHYHVLFMEDRVRINRVDFGLNTCLEILVSPEDDAEIRRLSITNTTLQTRVIDITSYAEIVIAPLATDIAHPAFSNLFIKTEYISQNQALLAHRQPSTPNETEVWAAHVLSNQQSDVQYETDRARFIGRGQSLKQPISVVDGRPLSNTIGAVLDPIFSLRSQITVAAGATEHLSFTTLVAGSRQAVIDLANKYHNSATWERVSALAWTHANVQLHHLHTKPDEAQLFQVLANHLLYQDPRLRFSGKLTSANQLNVSHLWRFGISGDKLIVLLHVQNLEDRHIVEQLLRAHEYWHIKGLAVDLVILNARLTSYIEDLQALLESLINESRARSMQPKDAYQGAIFLIRADQINNDERKLLQTAARVVLFGNRGTLAEQLARHPSPTANFIINKSLSISPSPTLDVPDLTHFNGIGGFAEQGKEYVIVLDKGQWTPAPWINVIANAQFGFTVSEAGSGCTWSGNSRENQLTPWSNDNVCDPSGEVFYIRDEETLALWTATALPIRVEQASYVIRHGKGYSRFSHESQGIYSELLQFVSTEDPIKISALTLTNHSGRKRYLSITAYLEWVLGASRQVSAAHVISEYDSEVNALFAYNPWSVEFGQQIAFADLLGKQTSWTANRIEFIGRNGSLDNPLALTQAINLKKRIGAGLDPCAALSTSIELAPGESIELVCLLGQGRDRKHARQLINRYRNQSVASGFAAVQTLWQQVLGKIQVTTPAPELDVLLNHWLLYQTLSCRMWARAAFYQVGGAFGFRDQLQDSMALVITRSDLSREQILLAAAHQFSEGDVQHWWHPPTGRGVRTRFTDDRIWLAFVVFHYLQVTGDQAILDQVIPFLDGKLLTEGQDDAYFQPTVSAQQATLFEHCKRVLEVSLGVGAHGLALMGSGDWNDGMSRVGNLGKGESVWLTWFLITTLNNFASVAEQRGETALAVHWRQHSQQLQTAVEAEGWDGAWYRRAYFDDGTALGSAQNAECRIDAIAQSWSVISGAATPERAQRAMQSVDDYLIRHGDELALLFTPPFINPQHDPGYIKNYPPGVRENGGQYTHAAVWSVIAYAMLGDGDQALELLQMLNPINRTTTRTGVYAYKVEPYVIAADIYSEPPHARRGGWTWYTGAAGWFYRAGLESVLGFQLKNQQLFFKPCIPKAWRHYQIVYQHQSSRYEINIDNPDGVMRGIRLIELDGLVQGNVEWIDLVDDGGGHRVRLVMG